MLALSVLALELTAGVATTPKAAASGLAVNARRGVCMFDST